MQNLSTVKYQAADFIYRYTNTVDFSSDVPTHAHDGWEFLFVKNGKFFYTVDGSTFDIASNSLILSRPGAVHMLRPKGIVHYERYVFTAAENILDKNILELLPADLHVLDVKNNALISSLYEKIGFYLSNLEGAMLEAMLRSILQELLVNIYLTSKEPSKPVASHTNPIVTRAIIYIRDHIQQPLTVQQVSDALFITPSHLHHCFVKHIKVTPKQYIMLQKLQLVQQALINAANPTEICRYYGFATYSTFYRNYQKIYGCRPSDGNQQTLRRIEFKG